MKKTFIALIVLAVVGGVAWFFLLRPENVSQETLTQDFETHRQAYEDVEFVYHSTGGKLRKLYGSVIHNGDKKVEGNVTVPLTTDGRHLYIEEG